MKKFKLYIIVLAGISLFFSLAPQSPRVYAEETGGKFEIMTDGRVTAGGMSFNSLSEYFGSKYFKAAGKRCATMHRYQRQGGFRFPQGSTSDCSLSRTTIKSEYEPGQVYVIPIVFHVISKTSGTGNISTQRIYDQVEVLNEDYRAMAGTLGSQGNDSMIQFELQDITRTVNNTWYQDSASSEKAFKNALGWDTDKYLNVYTNDAGGYLGYATLPQEDAGTALDGIVLLHEVIGGRDLAGAGEYDQGRTLVHEMGHYLGLLHTFGSTYGYDGCYTGYTAGDLIADTNSENTAHYGCSQTSSCGTLDPIHNYMNYTDDICMYKFTEEQINRMICSLVNYRPNLYGTSSQDSITVTSPNGGESWSAGSSHNVTWTSTGSVGNVKISYSTNNGSNWTTINSSTSNDGSYAWTLPATSSSQCLVKVNEANDTSVTDTSDAVFSIGNGTPDSITVTSPNGGESWDAGSSHNVTWTSTGSVGNVKISYSTNNGSNWTTVTASTSNGGSYAWTLPSTSSSQCLVRVNEASDTSVTDTSDAVFSIVSVTPPSISLNRTSYNFAGTTGGTVTGGQTLLIDNSGGGTLQWTASPSTTWLSCSPSSGTGSAVVTVSASTTVLGTGSYTGTVTVSAANATNSPRTVTVNLDVMSPGQDQPPFGTFSTPADGSTVSSSIPVTGWVLDDIEVLSVKIYRFTWAADIYIGDAVLVEGARSDIEAAYPGYPVNYKAGWGYMLLTNFLPYGGNGNFTLFAAAVDSAGHETLLGWADITCNNASAVKPFGAIDTPTQGGSASGSDFRNGGWVLTPQPNTIPTNGSTINVYVDGVYLGHPTYNIYRSDIASLFPGYTNSNGAHAYFDFDTTAYDNGIHSIYWTATDSGGNSDGIGSRFFTIQNTGSSRIAGYSGRRTVIEDKKQFSKFPVDRSRPVGVLTGYQKDGVPEQVYPGADGITTVGIKELERVVLHFAPGTRPLSPLPLGSSFDGERGIFYWQAGPGFVGTYELVFIDTERNLSRKINITISPKY